MLLHPQGMAPRIINLDEWAWHVIDRLRQEVLNIPNGRLDALVNELEALVPDRPRRPGPAAALVQRGCVRRFRAWVVIGVPATASGSVLVGGLYTYGSFLAQHRER
jgi:hypothetical protein